MGRPVRLVTCYQSPLKNPNSEHQVSLSPEDFEFLRSEADRAEITLEEYVSQMVDRQRLIVKYQDQPKTERKDPKPHHVEPPHRKWGM